MRRTAFALPTDRRVAAAVVAGTVLAVALGAQAPAARRSVTISRLDRYVAWYDKYVKPTAAP